MDPTRVLYVNGGTMHRGGIETFMMNFYRHFNRERLQVDFVVHGFEKGVYDEEIERMGGRIYHVPVKSKDYFGNIHGLKTIFQSGQYKIVHTHMDAMNAVVLKAAKQCGIPVRISHSHNTSHLTNNRIKLLLNEHARSIVNRYATHCFACSNAAGEWLYGHEAMEYGKVTIVRNAIDIDRYAFNEAKRNAIRQKLGLADKFVVGHIGRFDYQKNHTFLLDIHAKFVAQNPNAHLVLVGGGDLESAIRQKISDLNLEHSITLLGVRDDIPDLLNAFDFFVLPSHFEGLGIVLIEAQANGLQALCSDVIPDEANAGGLVTYFPLSRSADDWAHTILEIAEKSLGRSDCRALLRLEGYDIAQAARKLEDFYIAAQEANDEG